MKTINAKKVNADLGLMFRKKQIVYMYKAENIKSAVHMLFVFFPIDCYFLNKDFEIIEIKKNLKPFKGFYNPKKEFIYLLESPTGWLKNLKVGDKLFISFN